MRALRDLTCLLLLCLTMAGCSSGGAWKPVDRWPPGSAIQPVAGHYTVKAGDTLYSIAWRYGMDYHRLAAINHIGPPYTIRIGQQLQLAQSPPASRTAATSGGAGVAFIGAASQGESSAAKRPAYSAMKRATSSPSPSATRAVTAPQAMTSAQSVQWLWPADGNIIGRFSDGARVNKGIDIGGKLGDSVRSTRHGVVVYAGNGLAGYGNLVIIKHDDIYLSAYAHNRAILVREGQTVKAGDKIAEIGSSGAAYPKLHFEIRRDGKPVNPMQLLPRR